MKTKILQNPSVMLYALLAVGTASAEALLNRLTGTPVVWGNQTIPYIPPGTKLSRLQGVVALGCGAFLSLATLALPATQGNPRPDKTSRAVVRASPMGLALPL